MVEPPEREIFNPRRAIDAALPQDFYLRNADLTMRYRPIDYVGDLRSCALMLVAIKDDVFTFEDHARDLYDRAPSPKRLVVQSHTTHWQAYKDNFSELSQSMVDWFSRYLVPEPTISSQDL